MPACQCCGSESRRLQEFKLEYPEGRSAWICPNCFTECLENSRHLRSMVGEVVYLVVKHGKSIDTMNAHEIAASLVDGQNVSI